MILYKIEFENKANRILKINRTTPFLHTPDAAGQHSSFNYTRKLKMITKKSWNGPCSIRFRSLIIVHDLKITRNLHITIWEKEFHTTKSSPKATFCPKNGDSDTRQCPTHLDQFVRMTILPNRKSDLSKHVLTLPLILLNVSTKQHWLTHYAFLCYNWFIYL